MNIHICCGTDTVVNALIVAKEVRDPVQPIASPADHKQPTYLGQISVMHGPCSVIISPRAIQVENVIYRWPPHNNTMSMRCGQWMAIDADGRRHVTVTVQSDVVVRILRHAVSESHPFKVDFLGFYVERGTGLSEFTHGLIGRKNNIILSSEQEAKVH